jgi:acyl-CoA dehydrogenase
VVVVAAKTDPENKHSIGLFLVERGMPGFERGRQLKKMGHDAQDTAELFFKDVKVPKANVLGDPKRGFYYMMQGLAEERLLAGCEFLSASQKAFDITVDFVKQRKAFGKRVADFQNTQFKLADMRTQLDVAQTYLDQCVAAHNERKLTSVDAAKLKLFISELQGRVVDECLQLHGGAGFMDEYPISRLYRDARITRIYGGTSEIMKVIISKELLQEERTFLDRL